MMQIIKSNVEDDVVKTYLSITDCTTILFLSKLNMIMSTHCNYICLYYY